MIPKILHGIWVGTSPMPGRFKPNIDSWKKFNPSYDVKIWGNEDLNFDDPYVRMAYDQQAWAKLSDYLRLQIVRDHGGVYLDVDIEAIAPFDHLLSYDCFVGIQSTDAQDSPVCNAVIGAKPHHPFITEALARFPNSFSGDLYYAPTGPELVSEILLENGLKVENRIQHCGDVCVLPTEYFYPYHWRERFKRSCLTPRTVAIHYWDMSWHNHLAPKFVRVVKEVLKDNRHLYGLIRWLKASIVGNRS